jgi:Lipocalin-like domain
MSPGVLAGTWQLVAFHDLDDEGNRHEGPLGDQPRGLLCYSADGHVSVTMMREDVPAWRSGCGPPTTPSQR